MESAFLIALKEILATVGLGIFTNRTDAGVALAWKHGIGAFYRYLRDGSLPTNHELQKAVNRSLIRAQLNIAIEYKQQLAPNLPTIGHLVPLHPQRDNLAWANTKIRHLRSQLEKADRESYENIDWSDMDEIASLIRPEGSRTAEDIEAAKEALLESILFGDEPTEYMDLLARDANGLYELLCGNFANEVKANTVVKDLLQTQLLDRINEKLENNLTIIDLENSLDNVRAYLQEIVRLQEEQNEKLDDIGKDVKGLRDKLDGKYARLGKVNTAPSPIARFFVGREEDIENLHEGLCQRDRVSVSAVSGMGGVGKTELARHYVSKNADSYAGICWLNGQTDNLAAQALQFALLRLGLQVPQKQGDRLLELTEQVAWVWAQWGAMVDPPEPILIVVDDVANLNGIREYLPQSDRFRILITTRQRRLDPHFFELCLDVLAPEKALELLRNLVKDERIPAAGGSIAANLCQWLGYLPLAVELVGRHLALDPDLSLGELWERLQEKRLQDESLDLPESGWLTAQRNVAAAFALSWERLEAQTQAVARLLALYGSAPIPWGLVEEAVTHLEPVADNAAAVAKQARLQLENRNLLQREGQKLFRLHPLVREFFRDRLAELEPEEGLQWARSFAVRLVEIAKTVEQALTVDRVDELQPFIPHIEALAELLAATVGELPVADEDLGWPLTVLGLFYEGQGQYSLAEPWYSECVRVLRDRLGENHPDVAQSLNNLALLYRSQGRYTEAEPLYVQALELRRTLLGENHPDVATSLNNLALLYSSQGRYTEAEPLYLQALELCRNLLGENHPHVASSLNNLALLYDSQGRYSEAEPLYVQALELYRTLLGENHPHVATSLNNLALLYDSQGRYTEAEPLYVQALDLWRNLLGENHPHVASSLNNLAALYYHQQRYVESETLFVQALELYERLLGSQHPYTVGTRKWLEIVRQKLDE